MEIQQVWKSAHAHLSDAVHTGGRYIRHRFLEEIPLSIPRPLGERLRSWIWWQQYLLRFLSVAIAGDTFAFLCWVTVNSWIYWYLVVFYKIVGGWGALSATQWQIDCCGGSAFTNLSVCFWVLGEMMRTFCNSKPRQWLDDNKLVLWVLLDKINSTVGQKCQAQSIITDHPVFV